MLRNPSWMNAVALVLPAALVFAPAAMAACFVCNQGFCVPASQGQHGFRVCFDGGDPEEPCVVQSGTQCTGAIDPEESFGPVVTMGSVFRVPERAMSGLFAAGQTARVLHGAMAVADCGVTAERIARAAGVGADQLALANWHVTVAAAQVQVNALSTAGSGYTFSGKRTQKGAEISVLSSSGDHRADRLLAAASVSAKDLMLVSVAIDGEDYVLALQVAAASGEETLAAQLRTAQRVFKASAERLVSQHSLPLTLVAAEY